MAKTQTKTYRVLNPRGIDKGVHILRQGDKSWYEGDDLVPSQHDLSGDSIKRWAAQGSLEET